MPGFSPFSSLLRVIDSALELYSPHSDLFLDKGNSWFVSWRAHWQVKS